MTVKIKEVTEYVKGTNPFLDRVLEDEKVWIIQGSIGRLPIIANTEEEARDNYSKRDKGAEDEKSCEEKEEQDSLLASL